MTRRRLRKWAKWAFTLAAAAAAGLAIFSGLYWSRWTTVLNQASTLRFVRLSAGLLTIEEIDDKSVAGSAVWAPWQKEWSPAWDWGLSWNATPPWYLGVLYKRSAAYRGYGMSMVYPVVLTCLPAALLWYTDPPRFGPGRCHKCGYNRAGIASDKACPECGAVQAS
jgi:hypothetical protein